MGSTTINGPELWQSDLPVPQAHFNKYDRGFVGVFAAPELTGATRLAASACSRVGAGLVSVIAQTRQDIYRTCLPADLMVQDQTPDKVDTLLGGSGGMLTVHHNEMLAMQDCRGRIFDADGLPKEERFNQLDANCVLTPHRGEFERIFGPVVRDSESAARRAAQASGAIVVLKSHQTVIATPDVVLNTAPKDHAWIRFATQAYSNVLSQIGGQAASPTVDVIALKDSAFA